MFVVWVDTIKAGLLLVNLPLLYMFVGCLFPDAKYFLTSICSLVSTWYIMYYKVSSKDKSSFGGTD